MKTVKLSAFLIAVLLLGTSVHSCAREDTTSTNKVCYKPTWKSLSQWEVPQWFEDAVLGIYCHWGVYSVPEFPFDSGAERVDSGLWYGMFMYVPNDSDLPNYGVYDHHWDKYGDPAEFGYHDFVPMFKVEKWDPDRWAELHKYAGADFVGICAEHGDGFAMWDSEYDEYNAMGKGPRRDTLGEMFEASQDGHC